MYPVKSYKCPWLICLLCQRKIVNHKKMPSTKERNSHIYWGKIFLALKFLDSWYYYYYRWYQWKAPKSKLFSRLTYITVNFKIFTDITVFVDIKHWNFMSISFIFCNLYIGWQLALWSLKLWFKKCICTTKFSKNL